MMAWGESWMRALLPLLAGTALVGCSFEFRLEDRAFSCETDTDCLVEDGYTCLPNGASGTAEDPILFTCQRQLIDPDAAGPACTDDDGDGFWAGPEACRRCPDDNNRPRCAPPDLPFQQPCEEDPDDGNGSVHPYACEVCDGLDNDGDGLADRDDLDSDPNDSVVDGYVSQNCSYSLGVCEGAKKPCGGVLGYLPCGQLEYDQAFRTRLPNRVPESGVIFAAEEICGDGLDNDCDGTADPENLCTCSDGDQQSCRVGSFGPCAAFTGTKLCAGGGWRECQGAVEPSEELCNGIDDDCDNRADEDGICGACAWDSARVDDHCVDRYEASHSANQALIAASVADAQPWNEVSFADARQACRVAGKELCPQAIWEQACRGPVNTDYPYGAEFNADTCNGGGAGPEATGSRAGCGAGWPDEVVEDGLRPVFDMSGNLEEWVRPPADPSKRFVGGGSYVSAAAAEALICSAGTERPRPGEGAASIGFRCCKEIRD